MSDDFLPNPDIVDIPTPKGGERQRRAFAIDAALRIAHAGVGGNNTFGRTILENLDEYVKKIEDTLMSNTQE